MKKIFLITTVAGALLLSGCSPQPTVEFNGKTVPATTLQEAQKLDQEFLTTMCAITTQDTITQEYLDSLNTVALKYQKTPPVVEDYNNDWLKFPVMSSAIQDRVTTMTPLVGTSITEDMKAQTKAQCDFVQSSLDAAFKDFNSGTATRGTEPTATPTTKK